MIGVYIERENVVIKLRGILKCSQFNVCATVPFDTTFRVFSIMCEAKGNAYLKSALIIIMI